jgi:hypothetical protein
MAKLTKADLEELIRIELSKVFDLYNVVEDEPVQEAEEDEGPTAALMKPFTKLARGVLEEKIVVISEADLVSLMSIAGCTPEGAKRLQRHIKEGKFGMKPPSKQERIHALCNSNGYKTYSQFLRAVNALNAAEKGKLGNGK